MRVGSDKAVTAVVNGVHQVSRICVHETRLFKLCHERVVDNIGDQGRSAEPPAEIVVLGLKAKNAVIIRDYRNIGPVPFKLRSQVLVPRALLLSPRFARRDDLHFATTGRGVNISKRRHPAADDHIVQASL